MRLGECFLHGIGTAKPLDGRDFPALGERREEQAAGCRLAVQQHGAGAADADPARPAHAREPEAVEDVDQHAVGPGLDLYTLAVHDEAQSHAVTSSGRSIASRTDSGASGRSVTRIPSDPT